ncbi:MAG TPA: PAS domain-containing sensor histidine kinase [Gemmatimonadaceae bacterium]|nr:PAS domain-containing sensor histidine kinase [Gemmatimonadaceae bacterium]
MLVEHIADLGIFAVDPRTTILSWNSGAEQATGFSANDMIGRTMARLYTPQDLASNVPARELEQAMSVGRFEGTGWRVRRDHTHFWARVVITALRTSEDVLEGFGIVLQDLTAQRDMERQQYEHALQLAARDAARMEAEERARDLTDLVDQISAQAAELERRRVEADSASRAKTDFLATMSHELLTPLNAIGGYASLLSMGLRGPLTPEQRADVDRIRGSQLQLLGLINDLLNFTRIESGHVAFSVGDVVLSDVVREVAETMSPQVSARRLVEDRIGCSDAVVARADRSKVEQILLNLLSNAVKYTPPGGHLTWSCSAADEHVRLTIRDTGQGIPADRLEDIFEPFVQVGRGFARPGEGAGLGLAISRDLARAMGGDLTVESAPNEGSAFTLDLPRAR